MSAVEDFRADIQKRDHTIDWLHDENTRLKAQVTSLLTTLTQDEFPDPAILHEKCRSEIAVVAADNRSLRADQERAERYEGGLRAEIQTKSESLIAAGRQLAATEDHYQNEITKLRELVSECIEYRRCPLCERRLADLDRAP